MKFEVHWPVGIPDQTVSSSKVVPGRRYFSTARMNGITAAWFEGFVWTSSPSPTDVWVELRLGTSTIAQLVPTAVQTWEWISASIPVSSLSTGILFARLINGSNFGTIKVIGLRIRFVLSSPSAADVVYVFEQKRSSGNMFTASYLHEPGDWHGSLTPRFQATASGSGSVYLVNASGQTVASLSFSSASNKFSETEITAGLPGGEYFVQVSSNLTVHDAAVSITATSQSGITRIPTFIQHPFFEQLDPSVPSFPFSSGNYDAIRDMRFEANGTSTSGGSAWIRHSSLGDIAASTLSFPANSQYVRLRSNSFSMPSGLYRIRKSGVFLYLPRIIILNGVGSTVAKSTSVTAAVHRTATRSTSISGIAARVLSITHSIRAGVSKTLQRAASVRAAVQLGRAVLSSISAYTFKPGVRTARINGTVMAVRSVVASVRASVLSRFAREANVRAIVARVRALPSELRAAVSRAFSKSAGIRSAVVRRGARTASMSAFVRRLGPFEGTVVHTGVLRIIGPRRAVKILTARRELNVV